MEAAIINDVVLEGIIIRIRNLIRADDLNSQERA
jgi:hypothetical protein